MQRQIFKKKPEPSFEFDPEEYFELLFPLYSLVDVGDLRHKSLDNHLINELNTQPIIADPSLYFHFENDRLIGINGTYEDNIPRCSTTEFKQKAQLTK